MPFFQLDDTFDSSPEVLQAGTAAIGLYTRGGVWAARNLTDGFIPEEIATLYGTREWTARLTGTGLWVPRSGGFDMPDYLSRHRNLSAERVRALRAAAAERQARSRSSRRMSRVTGDVTHAVSHRTPSPLTGDGRAGTRATTPPDTCETHRLPLPCRGCRADHLAGDD